MRRAIHINDAEGVGPADIHDVHALEFRPVHELDAIRSDELANAAGRLATRVRFELVRRAVIIEGLRPWLERNFTDLLLARERLA